VCDRYEKCDVPFCVKVTVFDMNKHGDLDVAILSALLKGTPSIHALYRILM